MTDADEATRLIERERRATLDDRKKAKRWSRIAIAALLLLTLGAGLYLADVSHGRDLWRTQARDSADQVEQLQEHNAELVDLLTEAQALCEEAADCDVEALPDVDDVVQEQADEAEDAGVAPAPTVIAQRLSASELEAIADEAIEGCVASGECVGPQGEPAPPTDPAVIARLIGDYCSSEGACSPTAAEVYAAVALVCADGACVGSPGRAPTAEEIAAATAQCFASGACVAPAGQPGAQGVQGLQGASVVDVVCQANADGLTTLQFVIADPATGTSSVADSGAACTPATIPPTDPPVDPSPEPSEPGIDVPALPIP